MEENIAAVFQEKHIQQAAAHFDVEQTSLRALEGFENFIYEGERHGQAVVLRLSHSSKKNLRQVTSELRFIHYLAENGAGVAYPLEDTRGELIHQVPVSEGDYFSAVCFTKAEGEHPRGSALNDDLIHHWGAAMGKMHRLSQEYQAPLGYERMHWTDEIEVTNPADFLPEDQGGVIERMQQYTRILQNLPVDNQSYGVIHNDLHPGNFLFDGKTLTMIDFEDCVQMWYVSDLAISLFMSSVWPPNGLSREEFARQFWPVFLQAYREENELTDAWVEKLPLFIKFRELGQYVAMYRACDMNNPPPWVVHFMDGRRERVEQDLPFFETYDWLK
jgi:Ser/Thr protein kinase RdoA (MazF antagonist)